MFRHLLVPLDGSEAAEAAIAYSALIPARIVTLLHVVPGPDSAGYDWLTDVAADTHRQQQHSRGETYLASIADRWRRYGIEIRTLTAEGDTAEQIVTAAADATMVVMTSHGHGASSSAAYGRVVDRVVRHTGKPVLIVRGRADGAADPELARIVVPLDGSEVADEAAPLAAELSTQTGAPIHLISVVDPVFVPRESLDRILEHSRDYLASEAERIRSHAIDVTSEVRTGSPARQMIEAVRPDDMVVMTAFGSGGGERWHLGGVAEKLIRSAPAPVLVVRPVFAD